MAVLPLSMSLIFRLLIFSTIVTLIFHLYYHTTSYSTPLGEVSRVISNSTWIRAGLPTLQQTTSKTLGTMVGLFTIIDRGWPSDMLFILEIFLCYQWIIILVHSILVCCIDT